MDRTAVGVIYLIFFLSFSPWKNLLERRDFVFSLSLGVSNSRAGEVSVVVIFQTSPAEQTQVPGRCCCSRRLRGIQKKEEKKVSFPQLCMATTHTRECAKMRACCLSKYGSDALASWGVSPTRTHRERHNAEQQANFTLPHRISLNLLKKVPFSLCDLKDWQEQEQQQLSFSIFRWVRESWWRRRQRQRKMSKQTKNKRTNERKGKSFWHFQGGKASAERKMTHEKMQGSHLAVTRLSNDDGTK